MTKKPSHTTYEIYTQVIPVVGCSDLLQVKKIMALCGTPTALTYQKLASRVQLEIVKLVKGKKIQKQNLGYQVKSKKLTQEKATIQNFIRSDLRRTITTAGEIYGENFTQPIKGSGFTGFTGLSRFNPVILTIL